MVMLLKISSSIQKKESTTPEILKMAMPKPDRKR